MQLLFTMESNLSIYATTCSKANKVIYYYTANINIILISDCCKNSGEKLADNDDDFDEEQFEKDMKEKYVLLNNETVIKID